MRLLTREQMASRVVTAMRIGVKPYPLSNALGGSDRSPGVARRQAADAESEPDLLSRQIAGIIFTQAWTGPFMHYKAASLTQVIEGAG